MALGAVLALVLAGGGYLWSQLWFGGTRTSVAGSPYTLRVQGDPDLARAGDAERALTAADRYFATALGRAPQRKVEVRLAQRTPCVPFAGGGPAPTAVAQAGSLCIDADGPTWTGAAAEDPAVTTSLVAHEAFHTLQAEVGCLPGPDEHEYAWLVEGSATWVGWRAAASAGDIDRAGIEDRMRDWGGYGAGLPALAHLEDDIDGDAEYALAARAVDRLVADAGAESLLAFCADAERDWRASFRAAFGTTVDDFYDRFERLRRAGS